MPEVVINDRTYKQWTSDTGVVDFHGERLLSAMPRRTEYGDTIVGRDGLRIVATPLREDQLIPRSEWPDRIREKDRNKSWLHDLVVRRKVPCGDQNGTNYCHAFATVQAMQDQLVVQNNPSVLLSAMSIGGPITNWRNQGAYPEDDLIQAVEYGACLRSMQDKPYSFDYRRWDPAWPDARKKWQVDEWSDGLLPKGKAFDAAVTFALESTPSLPSFIWWSHAISGGYRVRDLGRGKFEILNRNNWGPDWGDNGFGWFAEGKGTPDICLFGIRLVTATG